VSQCPPDLIIEVYHHQVEEVLALMAVHVLLIVVVAQALTERPRRCRWGHHHRGGTRSC
jgi:hypothetical protein